MTKSTSKCFDRRLLTSDSESTQNFGSGSAKMLDLAGVNSENLRSKVCRKVAKLPGPKIKKLLNFDVLGGHSTQNSAQRLKMPMNRA